VEVQKIAVDIVGYFILISVRFILVFILYLIIFNSVHFYSQYTLRYVICHE